MSSHSFPTLGEPKYEPSAFNPSLPLSKGPNDINKRRLLLVYIHGFMGSEASFYKFPAHVHESLMNVLGESHIIYTRIYPRYKCRGEMKSAIDQLSTWLSPHEASDLDIILLGHSIGGALAAGLALLQDTAQPSRYLKHRIMGLVNFDVPFLGLHPYVIPCGIRSLFRRKNNTIENIPKASQGLEEMDVAYLPIVTNPNFDPAFSNDVRLIERGSLHGVMHFLRKNMRHLPSSIFDSVMSYYNFPGYLNRLPHLRGRYKDLMQLEAGEFAANRVRFVNYYTESTGHAKTKETTDTPHENVYQIDNRSTLYAGSSLDSRNDLDELRQQVSQSPSSSLTTTPIEWQLSGFSPATSFDSSTKHNISELFSNNYLPPSSNHKSKSQTKFDEKRTRTFVLKPSHHWKNGDDSLWIPVRMKDMDEVEAHQSMFLPQTEIYDQLVGDTVTKIEQWVQDEMSEHKIQQETQ